MQGETGSLLIRAYMLQRTDICALLTPAGQAPQAGQVHVNGLLVGAGSVQAAAEEAVRLVEQQGYSALKVKVTAARRTAYDKTLNPKPLNPIIPKRIIINFHSHHHHYVCIVFYNISTVYLLYYYCYYHCCHML